MKSWSSLLSIAMSHWIQSNYIYIKCFLVFAHDNLLHGKAPQSAQWGCPWLLLSTVKSHVGAPSPYSAYSSNWGPSKTDGLSSPGCDTKRQALHRLHLQEDSRIGDCILSHVRCIWVTVCCILEIPPLSQDVSEDWEATADLKLQ